VHVLIR